MAEVKGPFTLHDMQLRFVFAYNVVDYSCNQNKMYSVNGP